MSMIDAPVRSVFDCNVHLQAMANPTGPAGACLDLVHAGHIALFVSRPILAELIEVAGRPVLVRKLNLSPSRTQAFIDDLREYSTLVEAVPSLFTHPTDPKDSMYVDLAIACSAHVITTRDRHLLSLRDVSTAVGLDFMARFASIEVLTPVQLLSRVRGV
jgi:putative PIN family toxin of toxin-antitoxin system